MIITVFALVAALFIGLFAAEIIWTVLTFLKAAQYKNRIKVKNGHPLLALNWAVFIFIAAGFAAEIFALYKYDYKYSENVFQTIKVILYGTLSLSILFRMTLGTKAYITDSGIIAAKAFYPKRAAKYELEKGEVGTFITLYTKKKKFDFSFAVNPEHTDDMVGMMEYLGYEKYDTNSVPFKLKKESYFKRNLVILLCAVLFFAGGLSLWYAVTKPVVFVGDKIVETNSEYAIFSAFGFYDLLRQNNLEYYGEIAEKSQEMYDYMDYSHNMTSEDMAALKQMPNLKYLDVSLNDIDDLTEIGKLTQLEGLAFGGGDMYLKPKDYLPIKNLTNLKYFCGSGLNDCNDLTIFENMDNLIYFELTAADIQNGFDVICEKENLLSLILFRSNINDFSPIGKCKKLKSLSIGETNVTDLSFLENLTELEYLSISNTNAEDYSVLLEMPSLKEIRIENCAISSEIIKKLKENGVEILT